MRSFKDILGREKHFKIVIYLYFLADVDNKTSKGLVTTESSTDVFDYSYEVKDFLRE